LNLNYLELFYHVATHGGVTATARKLKRNQTSISTRINKLQSALGVTLFIRRPFALTPVGQRLYEYIEPFFSKLDDTEREIRGEADNWVRIGTFATVMRAYLPELLGRVKKQLPSIRFTLKNMVGDAMLDAVKAFEIDLGIGIVAANASDPKQLENELITTVYLALVVPERSSWRTSGDFLKRWPINQPLIALPRPDVPRIQFGNELKKRRIDDPPCFEVNALSMVRAYVLGGFGVGLFVRIDGEVAPKGLRFLPLKGFKPLSIKMYWRKSSKACDLVREEIKKSIKKIKFGLSNA